MNITVRADGIITNTLTEFEFADMMATVYGHDHTVDEYITLYNEAGRAQAAGLVVHKEVPNDVSERAAAMLVDDDDDDLQDHQLPVDEIIGVDDPQGFLDAASQVLGDGMTAMIITSDEDD